MLLLPAFITVMLRRSVAADEAVMMVKQFDNAYSPDSIAVQKLSGELLGYVPRRHNHRFLHDVNFGHVYAISQDAAGLWRLTVSLCRVLVPP